MHRLFLGTAEEAHHTPLPHTPGDTTILLNRPGTEHHIMTIEDDMTIYIGQTWETCMDPIAKMRIIDWVHMRSERSQAMGHTIQWIHINEMD